LLLAACGKGGSEVPPIPAPSPGSAAPAATGAQSATQIFATRCTPCHGATGGGDGAASASLNPKPRNFHDAAWQASVTDEHIEKIIHFGGAAVGKSAAMPSNPDLNDPTVIAGLKDIIRGLKQ
jgi:mono/diheme cytochrome c family protein